MVYGQTQLPRYDMTSLNRQLQDLLAQYNTLNQQQATQAQAQALAAYNSTPAPVQQITYVTGVDGARAVKLGPSSSVALLDSQEDVLYVKATDANGMETLFAKSTLKFEDVTPEATDAVTRKDLDDLKTELKSLLTELKGDKAE